MNRTLFPQIARRLSIDSDYISLGLKIFIVSLIAKAGFFAGGFAIDDYSFILGAGDKWGHFVSQGRFIPAVMVSVSDSFGIVIPDQFIVFGLIAILLQVIFLLSVLRFCCVDKLPGAAVIGALVVAHPYGAEIFTFKQALPFYSAALIFSILTLELILYNSRSKFVLLLALFSCLSMLSTYQIFTNFFAVLIPLAWIAGKLGLPCSKGNTDGNSDNNYDQSVVLAIILLGALVLYILSLAFVNSMGILHVGNERSQLIPFGMVSERIDQVLRALITIYWSDEPILPAWQKYIILAMLTYSVFMILKRIVKSELPDRSISIFLVFSGLLLLVPLSLGVIIPFQGWWPVPRVISHVSVVIGLVLIIGDYCTQSYFGTRIKIIQTGLRLIIIFGFILMGNQIFSDQRKINQWDKFSAQQIMARIEKSPNFDDVKFLYISGGAWGYLAGIRTVQGDMNISAFGAAWSKVNLVNYATGSRFTEATGERRLQAEAYCSSVQPWPAIDATKVIGDLAIVCRMKLP